MTDHEKVAAAAAMEFRDRNGLDIAPITDIVAIIEQTRNVDVAVLDVDDSDEHGLTMMDPERDVTVVAVASSENPMRWRSTLGHELGHLVFNDNDVGKPASLTFDAAIETRAQAFARHLLLPTEAVHRFMARRKTRNLATFSDLVQRFQVSPAIVAIQLCQGGYLAEDSYQRFSSMYTPSLAARFGWMDQYRALQAESRQRRSPQRLLARAVAGYAMDVVTIETLASVRGLPVTDLVIELDEAGITPHSRQEPATVPAEEDAGEFIDLSWLDDR
jgi:Zn-dependent peptidase ImmA (M78 family)